jgi:hypothetical protein
MVSYRFYVEKMERTSLQKSHRGRPPKFKESSGPVTVTLPDRTLDQLRNIDDDRAKAIVKAVMGSGASRFPNAEVIEMAPGTGVVVIPPNRSLRTIPWLKMIEVAPARYLLTIVPGTPIEKVEIALEELIEDARTSASEEVPMLETLRRKIGQLRRGEKISMAEILFVAM